MTYPKQKRWYVLILLQNSFCPLSPFHSIIYYLSWKLFCRWDKTDTCEKLLFDTIVTFSMDFQFWVLIWFLYNFVFFPSFFSVLLLFPSQKFIFNSFRGKFSFDPVFIYFIIITTTTNSHRFFYVVTIIILFLL